MPSRSLSRSRRKAAGQANVAPNATEVTRHVEVSLQGPSGQVLPELLRRLHGV